MVEEQIPPLKQPNEYFTRGTHDSPTRTRISTVRESFEIKHSLI